MKNRPIACCLSAARSIVVDALVALHALSERRKLAVVVLAVAALAGATAAAGKDLTPADKGNGYSACEEQASTLHAEGMRKGFDFGRNRIEDGKLLASGEVIPEPRPCEWRDYLDSQLNPPEPPVVDSPAIVATAPATTSVPTTSAGGCVGMEAESGSAGYGAYNPSSGAAGCYQIIPSTAAAHGCDLSTPDGQDACAQSICATQGPSAWSASGANPC